MRCKCCDALLNDEELNFQSTSTGEYLDTCQDCLDAEGSEYTDAELDACFGTVLP